MQTVAQSWVVLILTDSPFYLGLTGFAAQFPMILFTLVGGVVADRIDRRRLLLASQYIQMAVALVLALLIRRELIAVWHILTGAFIIGTAQAFGGPAYMALIPGLVRNKDVPNAIALNSIQFNLARSVGPLLAGWTLVAVGADACFALNGLSFIAVIISLYLIQPSFAPEKSGKSVLKDMKDGLSYVKTREALWQLILLGFASTFLGIPLLTLLPVFARDVFHSGAQGYSIMMACSGAGAVLGALGYASLGHMQRRGLLSLCVQGSFGLMLVAFALSRNLWLSYGLLLATGVFLIALFAAVTSLVQLKTSEAMRGRVLSIFMLAFRGGMPLGDLTAGWVAQSFSPQAALAINGALLTLIAAAFLISRSSVKQA